MVDVYIFLGPPGAGKGTLSNLFVKKLGWLQFSTGNVCREHIDKKTTLGKQIDFILKSGKLISDEIIVDIVSQWIDDNLDRLKTIILDGFPRTTVQARSLAQILSRFTDINLKVIRLSISNENVIERLSCRRICNNSRCAAIYSVKDINQLLCNICNSELIKRADDTESAIINRLDIYYRHEAELLKFYESVGQKIDQINVETSIENIFNQIVALT